MNFVFVFVLAYLVSNCSLHSEEQPYHVSTWKAWLFTKIDAIYKVTSIYQTVWFIRLKKKRYFVSKLARIFQTDAACVFLFFILFFFYFNWPLPPRTSETKNDWKVSTSVFSEIKRDFTRFLSSHVLKFFQNSKLSSFFAVKMKKKIFQEKKKMKVWILQNQMRTEKQMRAAALRHKIFFFFSLISVYNCFIHY